VLPAENQDFFFGRPRPGFSSASEKSQPSNTVQRTPRILHKACTFSNGGTRSPRSQLITACNDTFIASAISCLDSLLDSRSSLSLSEKVIVDPLKKKRKMLQKVLTTDVTECNIISVGANKVKHEKEKAMLKITAQDREELEALGRGVKLAVKVAATAVLLCVVLSAATSVFGLIIAGNIAEDGMTIIWGKP
jgi:hypothetical protein